jgi:hypothetical protein
MLIKAIEKNVLTSPSLSKGEVMLFKVPPSEGYREV